MGQCRNLLPVTELENFEAWLIFNGYEVKNTKAAFSAYQIRIGNKGYEVYVRDRTNGGNETVHASIYGPVIGLARKFLQEKKQHA